VRRVLVAACVAALLPATSALAQTGPLLRVTRDEVKIRATLRARGELLMMAPSGTILEVLHTDGDRYRPDEDNWYYVLLPPDAWGTQRVGWISERNVEHLPPAAPAVASTTPAVAPGPAPDAMAAPAAMVPAEAPGAGRPVPLAAPATAASTHAPAVVLEQPAVTETPAVPEVVVHFAFARSDLSDEAKATLATAAGALQAGSGILITVEGHTDWVGAEAFNERLGLARADAAKRYLVEEHHIPADTITVVSFGERQPAASNDTREGRAENRRAVVRVDD